MLTKIKRKYVDSHWLVFACQGAIMLLFGWFAMFAKHPDTTFLIAVVSSVLLVLGLIELFNVLHRSRRRHIWGLSIIMAVVEIGIALSLILTLDQNVAWHLSIIALYTLSRGLIELLIAIKSIDDLTDRFIWLTCGICGIIIGFVVFNSGHLAAGTFVEFFGAYMMILGIGNLIYGVHNRDQKLEAAAIRQNTRNRTTSRKGNKATHRQKRK